MTVDAEFKNIKIRLEMSKESIRGKNIQLNFRNVYLVEVRWNSALERFIPTGYAIDMFGDLVGVSAKDFKIETRTK